MRYIQRRRERDRARSKKIKWLILRKCMYVDCGWTLCAYWSAIEMQRERIGWWNAVLQLPYARKYHSWNIKYLHGNRLHSILEIAHGMAWNIFVSHRRTGCRLGRSKKYQNTEDKRTLQIQTLRKWLHRTRRVGKWSLSQPKESETRIKWSETSKNRRIVG